MKKVEELEKFAGKITSAYETLDKCEKEIAKMFFGSQSNVNYRR